MDEGKDEGRPLSNALVWNVARQHNRGTRTVRQSSLERVIVAKSVG